MNKRTKKSLLLGSVFLFGSIISSVGYAASVPCSTAKLIVPWKAGGGTHVLFSIFEKGRNMLFSIFFGKSKRTWFFVLLRIYVSTNCFAPPLLKLFFGVSLIPMNLNKVLKKSPIPRSLNTPNIRSLNITKVSLIGSNIGLIINTTITESI